MSQDATIISATLDTKELQKSIDAMVKNFDDGLQDMLEHTNTKVNEINAALKKISNINFDVKASKNSPESNTGKQAQKQDEVTKAVERTIAAKKEEKATYDQTAQAMQEAIKPKSARESYIAFQKGFKAQADAITQQIKLAEEALNKAIARRVDELNGKIANAKNKLNELFVTLEKAKQQQQVTGNYSQFQPAITRTQQQIENTLKYIDELKRKIAEAPSMFTTDGYLQSIERLKAERERISNIMREEVSSQQRIDQHTQQQLSKEEQITKEVQQQAKAIRESEQWKKEGRYLSGNDVYYDKDRANATKREKEQMLTLEEQILQKMNLREESERRVAQASRETNAALEQRGKSGAELGWKTVQEMQMASNAGGFSTQAKEIDYLRQQIAAILDVREQDVQKTNLQMATYNKLSAYLKQLQTAYQSLSADNLKREGSDIANEIQRVTRAMQQFQAQMNRPTSLKNVLGLDEKTIDDIAYKMQMLQRYRSGLNVDTQRNEINQVNQAYDRLKAKMDEVMAKSVQMNTINNALTRSFNYMKNRLAFYFTVGASTQFVKQLIEVRSQYELTERSLGILINSAEKGSQIFQELSQMSLISPYTLIELSNAARQLTAYGVAAKDVVDTTRRLADISAAVGAPVERIAYALGHVQSYGYLTSLQARQFANSGIPLVKELANMYTELEGQMVTTADVYDRMKKKQIEYADVMGVINQMTDEGGRFYEFQAKQAETLKVQLANLNLAYNNMLNEMGKSSQGMLTWTIGALKTLFASWETISKGIYTVVAALGAYKAQSVIVTMLIGKQAAKSYMNAIAMKDETAATYEQILANKNLTASQAKLLLSMNRSNVGLRTALVNMKLISAQTALNIASCNRLAATWNFLRFAAVNAIGGIVKGLKAIGSLLASNIYLIGFTVLADLVVSLFTLGKKTEEINEGIANSAKEASKSLEEFINTAKKAGTVDAAKNGKLSTAELEKTWTNIKEEIEASSSAGAEFVQQLMTETDLSERVTKAFDVAEKINSANLKMQELTDQIKISEDVWHGFFGEGLEEDFEDYAEKLKKWSGKGYTDAYLKAVTNEEAGEARDELKSLAEDIKETFSANNIVDENEVKEGLSKIREQIVSNSPKLKGAAADLFRVDFDKIMAENFKFDETASLWNIVLRELKKNYSQTFSSITDEIMDSTQKWGGAQLSAIRKTIDGVKKLAPEFSETLDKMQTMINEREFKARILFTFDIAQLDDIQKDFNKRFIKNTMYSTGEKALYGKYNRKTGEDDVEWGERLDEDRKKREKVYEKALSDEKKYAKDKEDIRYKNAISVKNAQKTEIDAINNVMEAYNLRGKETKKGKDKDPILSALKDEISLVKKLQSEYDKLTKKGATQSEALESITSAYGHTLRLLNKDLQSFGLPKLDLSIITGKNPHDVLAFFERLRDIINSKGMSNLERMKAIEGVIEEFTVSVKEYNLDKVTKGLNNELGKLKEEYELAVELDANPELGGIFADMMGLSKDEIRNLPRTYSQLAVKIQDSIDKVFDGNNIEGKIDITKMLNKDDFDKWAKERGNEIDDAFIESINKVREYLNKVRLDEAKETIKNWSNLVEKYGNIQDRVLKIYKDTVKEQVDVIRQFGNEKDVINAIDIADKINVSNSPEQIARLQKELAELIKKVTEGKDTAISINAAIEKEGSKSKAKAIWDDFKNSDEYAQMFDNLEYLSTSSIEHILDKLEELKDKVKEDPASMKAYFDQLQTARDALVKANPFKGASEGFKLATEGIKEYFAAINESGKIKKDLNEAKDELKLAKQSVVEAIQEYGKFQDNPNADIDARLKAQNKLNNAKKAEKDAQQKVNTLTEQQTNNENKLAVAIKKIKSGIDLAKKGGEKLADKLGDLSGALSSIGDMFKAFGDDDTADAINDINTGFQVMQSVIMAVVGVIIILEATASPMLVAMTALVGLFIGLAALFQGSQNRRINREIEKSEASVRKLELAYKDLEAAIKYAYGAEEYGLKQAELANKKLQLAEMKRQLELERSRTGKHYDQEKVDDYIGKVKDLENEIAETTHNIVEEILGISSVGDAAEELVSSMIDAFRKGEDYMANYAETFENMIENMIVQAIASRVIGDRLQQIWDALEARVNARTEGANADIAKYTQAITEDEKNYDNALQEYNRIKDASWLISDEQKQVAKKQMEFYKQQLEADKNALAAATLAAEEAGRITPADVDSIRTMSEGFKEGVMSDFEALMEAFDIHRGDLAETENLSNLQQGIQGITEDTASALEGMLNGISQQIYLHSDILIDIRDTLHTFDFDIHLDIQSQMLLQLQNGYQTMNAMRTMMENWQTPSGNGIRVEML